jgi:hypothetical protein
MEVYKRVREREKEESRQRRSNREQERPVSLATPFSLNETVWKNLFFFVLQCVLAFRLLRIFRVLNLMKGCSLVNV